MSGLIKNNRLFRPRGIYALLHAICTSGINLFVIIRTAARLYPEREALIFENERITYKELQTRITGLATFLKERYNIKKKQRIALICRNHPPHIYALFAAAGLGCDIYFLNPDMGKEAFLSLIKRHSFDFIIHDTDWSNTITEAGYENRSLPASDSLLLRIKEAEQMKQRAVSIRQNSFGRIVVLTSGSTGNTKPVSRKTSATAFISPFIYLLNQLKLSQYNSLYLATPVYHGFGLAALFVALILGKKVYMRNKFNAHEACHWIQQENIEVITLVPSMLQRMLKTGDSQLDSLKCIISGGAMLPPTVIEEAGTCLSGNKIFNLYGSSEAGFCIMATPEHLDYSEKTIGKPVKGVQVKIINQQGEEVPIEQIGEICIKCKWSVNANEWIPTGDLGYRDINGYYYLMGRTDDMIISGGENVYPYELENLLLKHPLVCDALVTGVADPEFGQRLKAFIIPQNNTVTEQAIKEWLSTRCARYQMPRDICFMDEFPLTGTGKKDKRVL